MVSAVSNRLKGQNPHLPKWWRLLGQALSVALGEQLVSDTYANLRRLTTSGSRIIHLGRSLGHRICTTSEVGRLPLSVGRSQMLSLGAGGHNVPFAAT